jgi:hypothetical protein
LKSFEFQLRYAYFAAAKLAVEVKVQPLASPGFLNHEATVLKVKREPHQSAQIFSALANSLDV